MNARADELRSEVLALPDDVRAELIVGIFDSLDDRSVVDDQNELDGVWAVETARRAEQLESGEVTMDSWDDLLRKASDARRTR